MALVHVPYECAEPHDSGCNYCQGGLMTCTVCGSSEVQLTTDCPGHKVPEWAKDAVSAGQLNYREATGWVVVVSE